MCRRARAAFQLIRVNAVGILYMLAPLLRRLAVAHLSFTANRCGFLRANPLLAHLPLLDWRPSVPRHFSIHLNLLPPQSTCLSSSPILRPQERMQDNVMCVISGTSYRSCKVHHSAPPPAYYQPVLTMRPCRLIKCKPVIIYPERAGRDISEMV